MGRYTPDDSAKPGCGVGFAIPLLGMFALLRVVMRRVRKTC